MRRPTLILIVVLLVALIAAAAAQLFLAQGERRFPGPDPPTTQAP